MPEAAIEIRELRVDYDRQIRDLREGISEAVLNEGVPPVYHDTIRRYFDSLADGDKGAAPLEKETP